MLSSPLCKNETPLYSPHQNCGVSLFFILRSLEPSFAKASESSPRLAYSAEADASAAKTGYPRSKALEIFGEEE
jgi:hypothetical protein